MMLSLFLFSARPVVQVAGGWLIAEAPPTVVIKEAPMGVGRGNIVPDTQGISGRPRSRSSR